MLMGASLDARGPEMTKPTAQRDIIDRRRLMAEIVALADEGGAKSTATRVKILGVLGAVLESGRAEIRRRFESGLSGLETAQANAFLTDQLVRTLYDYTTQQVYRATNPTAAERLSVVAVGGYGRSEMAPFSDVDLLFLHPYKLTAWGEQVIEYVLYLLWDLGLKVGQATRSVDDCMRLAKGDISIRTAILEARYVWGDRALYDELRARFSREVIEGTGHDFVEAKLAERDSRHKKLGDSRYLVEPNVKDGKGGLRDLHTLFWIAKYVYDVREVEDLVGCGVLTQEELRRFRRAENFLWAVRCTLHYLTGRAEERLTFDLQPEIARHLRYRDKGHTSSVERFMKHYYLVAKEVGDLTRVFCASLEHQQRRKPVLALSRLGLFRRDLEGFVDDGGRLTVADPGFFRDNPVAMIRLFRVAQEHDRDIHPDAIKYITRALKSIDDSVRHDPEANDLFMQILTSRKSPEKALRRMNEAGVFGQFIPDFGRVVAQMQHDMYHVYTVDEHTIRAIGILSRIEAGELKDENPLASELIGEVLSRRVLYVSVLLHDIAKGRGGDHSVLGEQVAQELCPRLGLEPDEVETTAWLVRWHLAMSHTAFKRDVHDPKTILDFKELVQSVERLRLLLILTVADIRAVGPGRWNRWKGGLLRDLYYTTRDALTGAFDSRTGEGRKAVAVAALRDALGWPSDVVAPYVERFYRPYWLGLDTETQVRHARLIRAADAESKPVALATHIDEVAAVTEMSVYTADHPGLFSRLAGAIAAAGANIVDARIHTSSGGMAIDTFWLQDEDRRPFSGDDKIGRLRDLIEKTLDGRVRISDVLARRPSRLPSRTHVFSVQPRVLIDNKASNLYTVVEINARDRAGLLFDVTRAITAAGVQIASAQISTYGERAVDVFYIKDVFGLKITHDSKVEKIRNAILEALRSGEDRAQAASAAAE
jgi:[protein-PII] uridylyltransferase